MDSRAMAPKVDMVSKAKVLKMAMANLLNQDMDNRSMAPEVDMVQILGAVMVKTLTIVTALRMDMANRLAREDDKALTVITPPAAIEDPTRAEAPPGLEDLDLHTHKG